MAVPRCRLLTECSHYGMMATQQRRARLSVSPTSQIRCERAHILRSSECVGCASLQTSSRLEDGFHTTVYAQRWSRASSYPSIIHISFWTDVPRAHLYLFFAWLQLVRDATNDGFVFNFMVCFCFCPFVYGSACMCKVVRASSCSGCLWQMVSALSIPVCRKWSESMQTMPS